MSTLPAFHSVFGLLVRSDFALPGWPSVLPGDPAIEIRRAACDAPAFGKNPHTARFLVRDGELQVAVTGVGRYAACGGRLIKVDPDPTALREDILLYLTGAMVGATLHQRGLYPLHASSVTIGGIGVGFAGRSGAGKSTLVSTMIQRGARLVTDDVCVLTELSSGELVVWPGAPRVKLDEAALANVPSRPEHLEAAGGPRGKYHLPVAESSAPTAPVPFRHLFILADGEGEPRIERLTGIDAVSALMDETYLLTWVAALGLSSQVFRLVGRVARTLHISRLVRPRGMEHLPATAHVIERQVS
jgi:hypothetical protein